MAYQYTDFQLLVHSLPESYSRFLGGGRGGGKSEAAAQDIGIVAERHQQRARILFLRQGPYKSLTDVEETIGQFFDRLWGPRNHNLNKGSHRWELPTGTYFELGVLPDGDHGRRYYERTYQGRSFTHVYIDEAQQWSAAEVIDLVTSNLRGPIDTRLTVLANPGGLGHQWLVQRYIKAAEPWTPFEIRKEIRIGDEIEETRRTWISCPSTYRDNPHLGDDYLANLASSCGHDEELLKAWVTGNWDIARGSYFAAVLDSPRIKFTWPPPREWGNWRADGWDFWLAYDHGTAAPAVCYVVGKSPGAMGPDSRYYPHGSILLLDEYACHREGDLGRAFGWTVPQLAAPIRNLADRWHVDYAGLADDQCFAEEGHEHTIAEEYGLEGIRWRKARKGARAPRFLQMKRMLDAAGNGEGSGLYVSTKCDYWWRTVPFIVHDPSNPEVPLKCSTDHGLDASSYGLASAIEMAGAV